MSELLTCRVNTHTDAIFTTFLVVTSFNDTNSTDYQGNESSSTEVPTSSLFSHWLNGLAFFGGIGALLLLSFYTYRIQSAGHLGKSLLYFLQVKLVGNIC